MNSADGEPLETFRPGYPRYSALLSTHASFQKFRRFTEVRMRLLLLKQDEISVLEQALSRADADEPHGLFLGCARRDQNSTRKRILDELRTHLAEYDTMLQQSQWVQSLSDSSARDIQSLQNWVQGTGCIAREEREYLDHGQDLASLVTPPDIAVERTLPLLEDFLCFLQRTSRRVCIALAHVFILLIMEDIFPPPVVNQGQKGRREIGWKKNRSSAPHINFKGNAYITVD
ncbi:uncharacterized protein BO95DRAFT_430108 [Aspergillus brunneoviolaceus CBS 621.78]|uniref:Uncharacterized protein n=1 Tax=Aspergillus brunneoviolaceus CBS 621.78 TaxID=1450534 RepID=A0ACD1GEU1_9EURO|nr:hypothetical protein BO95DRAFT_430108 [Aspergillus brunneoviolaceus CBS 621.78]RAH47766.1 hypothetical protein BO95DRAFT_430108 [Aspergillus brunneoviolaceus CBS 621.78]